MRIISFDKSIHSYIGRNLSIKKKAFRVYSLGLDTNRGQRRRVNARAGSRRAPTGSGYRFLYVILSNIKHLLSLIKHLWKLEQMELSDSNLKYLFIRLWINAEALPFFGAV